MRLLKTYASFIRVSHSVFALPFALVGALLAAAERPVEPIRILWIVLAMVTARSAAMAFNRIVDARWDALNPRTANREIPTGKLTSAQAMAFLVVTSAGFIASTWPLGMVCFALSPVALAIVFWYSLAKRVTSYTQFFLGLAMAVAPVGGFDVLYACQDLGFDREHGLRSIPVRFGVARSLLISRGLHVLTIACLVALGLARPLGPVYFGGVAAVALLLFYEQTLVREDDLSQVKRAFDLNGYVGILYLITTGVAVYVR